MTPISFFKLQAKNLHKDYKTQFISSYEDGIPLYSYKPKYFDIDEILIGFGYEELEAESFTLMKAQHMFSMIMDVESWSDLINRSEEEQEVLITLFKNKMHIEEWRSYVHEIEVTNNVTFEFKEQIRFINQHFIGKDTIFHGCVHILIHNFK